MIDEVKEWWGPAAGCVAMLGSYFAGRERTRHRIAEVSKDLEAVQAEMKVVREHLSAQSVQLATIITDLKWIKANQEGRP